MLSSLRTRLLLWYTTILAAVVAVFAGTVCYLFWRSLVADIDAGLRTSATALVEGLRPSAFGDFDLVLPPEYRAIEGVASTPTYYTIWNRDGELIDRSPGEFEIPAPAGSGMRTRDGRRELIVGAAAGALVLVGRDLSDARRDVLAFAGTAAAGGLAALLLSLVGGWFLVGRAVAPVHLAIENERRFTADASHELRTPLATISAEVEWALARTRSDEEYRRSLGTVSRAADRMRRIVERLLTLARADSAEMTLQRTAVGLKPVISDALDIVQPLAEQKRVTIETRLDAATVVGDRDRLTDLVTNLFSNAIQYNRDGGRVSVEVWPEGNDACLRVRDTGTGISAEDLPRVFERFYRADKARTTHAGGAGLGLAIAKWIVDAHGGRIACQSVAGEGTEVLVRLPRLT